MADNEWRTPPELIESARKVMGSIDCDPASSAAAQLVIKAKQFFTKETNGLDKLWLGNVWLNPPYGRGEASPFVERMVALHAAGDVYQGIVLLNTVYTSDWWRRSGINDIYSAICLPSKRIAFINPETGLPEKGNDRDQIIVYLGDYPHYFCEEFSKYGVCHLPHRGTL